MSGPVDEASSRVPRLREIKQNIIIILLKVSQNTGMETNNFQQTNDGLCLTILFYLK